MTSEEQELWEAYWTDKTKANRWALVQTYMYVVVQQASVFARKVPGSHFSFEDLKSEGLLGLYYAIESFKPAMKVRFPRYAAIRVRGQIQDALRETDWVPRDVRHRETKITNAVAHLESELDRRPTLEEVAKYLNIPVATAKEWLVQSAPSMVNFATMEGKSERNKSSWTGGNTRAREGTALHIKDRALKPDDQVMIEEFVDYVLAEFTHKEQLIIKMLAHGYNQATISKYLNISQSHMSTVTYPLMERLSMCVERYI